MLITGATGMVGRNILEHASIKKYQILTPPSNELNLLEAKDVQAYFNKNRPDIVIHCAGVVGGIQANIREPVRFLVENLEMGKNILLAASESKVEKLINLASSCMYPKNSNELLKEGSILTGELEPTNEGYALAKITVMKLAQYLNRELKVNSYKTLIPCNLYGRWDKFSENHSHMLPAVIKKIHKAILENYNSVDVWGTGEARREFMYCADLADFVFFALENWDMIPEIINVGLGFDYSINDYYKNVAEVLGYSGKFHHDLSKPEGMKRKVIDVSKAKELGWSAKSSLRDGIRETYEFYLKKGIE